MTEGNPPIMTRIRAHDIPDEYLYGDEPDRGPNRPDPDTGWQPGKPVLVLVAGEDGAILGGWRVPSAHSPDGAVTALADDLDADHDAFRFPPVDPAAWFLLSTEHAPAGDPRRAYGTYADALGISRSPTGRTFDELPADRRRAWQAVADAQFVRPLDADPEFPGPGGWQGRSGGGLEEEVPASLRPAVEAIGREVGAARTGARGAALSLNARVRDADGGWLPAAQVAAQVAAWLGTMGVAPADRPEPRETRWAWLAAPALPDPPGDMGIHEAHRWICQWALTVQAPTIANLPGLVFHGTPESPGCTVSVEAGGRFVQLLANTGYMKSPTGFGAGYEGSGAAALARSLLVATLGQAAACRGCWGSGKVTYLASQGADEDPVPWLPEHDALARPSSEDPEEAAGDAAAVVTCHDCDGDGIRVSPAVYQAFKREVVAVLPGDGEWWLSRRAVLKWIVAQAEDAIGGDLTAAAAGMLS